MMLIQLLFVEPILFLVVTLSILFALSFHEYFHAWMANFLGDPTAKLQGRLTINPLAHLDLIGTILLLTAGFGWGKPVPFNPYNLRNRKQGELLVSLAGPVSNLLIATIIGLFLRFFLAFSQSAIFLFLSYFVWINIIFGIFNLLPAPPLDGSHIFLNFLPPSLENIKIILLQSGPFLIIPAILFMIYVGFPYISKPLFQLITGLPLPF